MISDKCCCPPLIDDKCVRLICWEMWLPTSDVSLLAGGGEGKGFTIMRGWLSGMLLLPLPTCD